MRAIILGLMLLMATPALGFHEPVKKVEATCGPSPCRVLEVRPTRDPVKPKTFKEKAKEVASTIGRGGLIAVGINAIVWGTRIGLAVVGIPIF